MAKLKTKFKASILGLTMGIFTLATTACAETRYFTFHMNTSYSHGSDVNCGYTARKADDEQKAYVTVTSFKKTSGSPSISMWVGPNGNTSQLTTAWTWTSTGKHTLDYFSNAKAGNAYQLCAEQFGNGSVVVDGRWTP